MSEHFIIAGIAAKDQSALKKSLQENGLRASNTIIFLTVKERNPTYKTSVIETMIDSLANTVSKKLPEKIRVIYMPYKNSDKLKGLFFPFADTQSFDDSETYYDYALKYVNNIDELGHKLLKIIRNGIKIKPRPSKKHCLLLPNKNFAVGNKDFSELLYEFYFGNLDENIFNNIKKNTELRCYEDSRNLAFPATKMNEGNLRYKKSEVAPRHFLGGIYRFGMLWGAGFHFDVKHISKPTLNGYKFTCSVNGEIERKGITHINIYLNDFIRVPQKSKWLVT
jgi:hypothetical protein